MPTVFEGIGLFLYPLLFCAIIAFFVVVERLLVLSSARICPPSLLKSLANGKVPPDPGNSMLGRMVSISREHQGDDEAIGALARLEANRLQRGLVVLEIVIAIAPLLGLLGTVTGLITVFGNISPETGMPDPGMFVEGVALALMTTGVGLAIAIPGLVFHGYFQRKAETFTVELESALALVRVAEQSEG
ncbi:MAG: MotA/TolQ/ExbB proton channel family protein [Opitutales bacterium]|nr:MotA/TolQ/ExbB proton channel family protein [Opitutales bacterium]MCH8540498.1 MotA/TolQ/ExbB proton channel family protein [Opitutales bacterium]